jgi:alpha-glucosidase (family GH31 glycosyl hydrolase)
VLSIDPANVCVENRLHVKIYDADEQVYQVPESVFPRPDGGACEAEEAALSFQWTEKPFSFKVVRKSTNETLFDTSAASLVFENQYLRVRTSLPDAPHLYGLGEHTDPFQLNTTNYTRTVSLVPMCDSLSDPGSFGTAMHTAFLGAPTCTDTTPSTSTTAAHLAPMASSF